jgi:hypothetical protein
MIQSPVMALGSTNSAITQLGWLDETLKSATQPRIAIRHARRLSVTLGAAVRRLSR